MFCLYYLLPLSYSFFFFFFFNDTATTEIYTLSLHDALPINAELPGADRRDIAAGAATDDEQRGRSRVHRPTPRTRLPGIPESRAAPARTRPHARRRRRGDRTMTTGSSSSAAPPRRCASSAARRCD